MFGSNFGESIPPTRREWPEFHWKRMQCIHAELLCVLSQPSQNEAHWNENSQKGRKEFCLSRQSQSSSHSSTIDCISWTQKLEKNHHCQSPITQFSQTQTPLHLAHWGSCLIVHRNWVASSQYMFSPKLTSTCICMLPADFAENAKIYLRFAEASMGWTNNRSLEGEARELTWDQIEWGRHRLTR